MSTLRSLLDDTGAESDELLAAFHAAVEADSVACVTALLERVGPTLYDLVRGFEASRSPSMIRAIVPYGVDVNAPLGEGWSPPGLTRLHRALDMDFDDIIQLGAQPDLWRTRTLIELGADPAARTTGGKTVFEMASDFGPGGELLANELRAWLDSRSE